MYIHIYISANILTYWLIGEVLETRWIMTKELIGLLCFLCFNNSLCLRYKVSETKRTSNS